MFWVKVAGLHIPMLGTVDIPNFGLDTAPRHLGLGEHEAFTVNTERGHFPPGCFREQAVVRTPGPDDRLAVVDAREKQTMDALSSYTDPTWQSPRN